MRSRRLARVRLHGCSVTSEAEARQSLRAVGARCSRVAALAIVALVVSGIASPHSARAQEVAEGQTLPAQYVLLLDDSRSMRDAKSDPDRLAVFAARSMLALLEDKDEVSLYRLNRSIDRKPSDAAQASMDPPQRLGEVRQRLEDALANDKPFAEYGGDATPCSAAFKVIADGLNEAHKRAPNARQVLIYLTDGVCENGAGTADVFDGDGFLKRIDSAAQQRFLFYVLRFRGRGFTQGLTALADKTHGATFEVTSDATGILGPFARALSQAQGFDALEVTPQNPTIAAHSSARRIRLLAVAEGEGPPLEIGLAVQSRFSWATRGREATGSRSRRATATSPSTTPPTPRSTTSPSPMRALRGSSSPFPSTASRS